MNIMKSESDNTSNYEKVSAVDQHEESIKETQTQGSWKIFLRQLFVCSTIWTLYFTYGLQLGAPTIIISQMRKDINSTVEIDDELMSWIISALTFGAAPSIILVPILIQLVGTKRTILLVCCCGFLGALIIYLSRTITQLIIGEVIFGVLQGTHLTNSPLIICEYTSPEYRGVFLTIKSASVFWAVWVANTIGTFWHWKNIYLVHFICNAYTLTIFIWPESFYWLAKKERYEECKKSHRWIKGTSRNNEKELLHIVNYYESNHKKHDIRVGIKEIIYSSLNIIQYKGFYKPLLLMMLCGTQYLFTGKTICSIYAIQLLKNITKNEASAYRGMLILDGVTVFATYCGCIMSKYCKRRTILFSTSVVTVIFLYIIALYLYLVHISVITENNYLFISLLSMFSITVCSGPMILLSTIYSELISVRYQTSSMIIFGSYLNAVTMLLFKTTPSLFKVFTVSGVFLFFAISSSIITFILYLYLPETKDKTLREIEEYFAATSKLNKKDRYQSYKEDCKLKSEPETLLVASKNT